MKKEQQQDHVDRWLESAFLDEIPNLNLEVEGIVDRVMGLSRRFKRSLNETLADFSLSHGEWDVLGALRRAGPPYRRSAGELAGIAELSSGAMTNRLDRLEKQDLIRRLPDPDDRRGVLVELTKAGHRSWDESVGAQAAKEVLITGALNATEKKQLNALLRRLMIEFEEREGSKHSK